MKPLSRLWRGPTRVANKILLLVLLLELLSMAVWGTLTYRASRTELLHTIASRLNETAVRTVSETGAFFEPLRIEVGVLATNIGSGLVPASATGILLNRLLRARPEVAEASLVQPNGRELQRVSRTRSIGPNELRTVGELPTVRRAIAGHPALGRITFSQYFEPRIRLAWPVPNAGGDAPHQVVLTSLNLKWLWGTVQAQHVGQTGYVYVVDERGDLVAHRDTSLVLSRLHLPDTGVPAAMLAGDGQRELLVYDNFSGRPVVGVSRFDPRNHWWVVVEQPVEEALAPLDRVVHRFVLAFSLAAAVAVLIVLFFSRWTMQPLEALERGIARLAAGERKVRVQVPRHTELATLSEAFNTMAEHLDRYTGELQYQASHDALTGLPNRQRLHQALEARLADLRAAHGAPFALLLIDLDGFKEVNDALGHKAGDHLLRKLGPRLRARLNRQDVLVRLGGDEFAVLLAAADGPEPAERCALELLEAIREPFALEGINVHVDASIGIALAPAHCRDSSTLLRFADVAMYHAKRQGKGCSTYARDIDGHSTRRLELLSSLRGAIAGDELELFYQPKLQVQTQRPVAAEALVRWRHPQHGLIMPDQFVPLAELSDLINPLTRWVLTRALRDCARWAPPLRVAVNVSARNLQDGELPREIAQLLAEAGVPAGRLQLEITESAIMLDPDRARETIRQLAEVGVSLAIDDFGTGYSSLAYLKELAVDELKIDKSFVVDMRHDENNAIIVRSTVELAHNLGMRVTAEGVEDPHTLRLLAELDCDFAQGYLFSRPLPAATLPRWLSAHAEATVQWS